MPAITFATPPSRPSVLRATSSRQGQPDDDAESCLTLAESSHFPSAFADTASIPASDVQPAPLTFQKRIVPQLTTSPEPLQESFNLPKPRISLDETTTPHGVHHGESHKLSLLSTTMANSSGQPPRSSSTTNLGILRRTEAQQATAGLGGPLKVTSSATEPIPQAPKPRLHFVEPFKHVHSHDSAASEPPVSPAKAFDKHISAVPSTSAATAAAHPTPSEAASRKKSLVIQEHADVLERAAERAARQANLSTEALEQHSRTGAFSRSRHYSTSSAGEETTSTRSSWALRSGSRGSSVATSPTLASHYNDDDDQLSQSERQKSSQAPAVVSIFHKPATEETAVTQPQVAPATAPRKLQFIDPAPTPKKSPPRPPRLPAPVSQKDAERATFSLSEQAGAIADHHSGEHSQAPSQPAPRALSFADCPKPERAHKLSPAHATRKRKSKLSASPAPHKLAYPQRLRGIRGTDPIRSPAPNALATTSEVIDWSHIGSDVSSGESGYSEDEEDDDSKHDDDEEQASDSNDSDIPSASDSQASLDVSEASPHQSLEREELQDEDPLGQGKTENALDFSPHHRGNHQAASNSSGQQRRASTPGLQLASKQSPVQESHGSKSNQTSPRSGPSLRSGGKLKAKESFTHPMCFLPDAFEDSAPPTPTEPDSDAYEPPRANLLQGWLSEGGSASNSRRASWQQQQLPSPYLRSGRSTADGGQPVPISMPPFRRSRERTPNERVTSDGEQSSRSLGGNAAFIRESAGFGQSFNWDSDHVGQRSIGASPGPSSAALGISVPLGGRPGQHVSWRQHSAQQGPVSDRSSSGVSAFRRSSHSLEPRRVFSAFTSPVGSYAAATGKAMPSHAGASERPLRPSIGKQRAVSTSSHIRSRPLVAPSTHEQVVAATSPPRDDAFTHLKHVLATSPRSHSEMHRDASSGTTTPGWTSDGQLPSQTTSRYWTERLSSLAQAMSEELSIVGSAVLGYEHKASSRAPQEQSQDQDAGASGALHQRSHSSSAAENIIESTVEPDAQATVRDMRRHSIPVPIKPKPAGAWTAERDGETQAAPKPARLKRSNKSSRRRSGGGSDSSSDDGNDKSRFQFAKQEVGEDGHTRLVVIHTSKAEARRGEEREE